MAWFGFGKKDVSAEAFPLDDPDVDREDSELDAEWKALHEQGDAFYQALLADGCDWRDGDPIIYHDEYNVSFFGIENLHPCALQCHQYWSVSVASDSCAGSTAKSTGK